MKICDKSAMKSINAGSIMKILLSERNTSQTELVNRTGLKKATVSMQVKYLKKNRLVVETGVGVSGESGGRRPRYLELAKENILAMGASVRGSALTFSLVDLNGRVLWKDGITLKQNRSSRWIPLLEHRVSKVLPKLLRPRQVFLGLGFSIGGIYDPEKELFLEFSKGRIAAQRSDERDVSVKNLLGRSLTGVRVVADDFPNAMAHGEMWFGCAGNLHDFIYLQLVNLKATIVSNRSILRGHNLLAGEITDWRYGKETMTAALTRTRFSPAVLLDLFRNLLLSYSPEKIVISRENLPEGFDADFGGLNRTLAGEFNRKAPGGDGENAIVMFGELGREDGARAAAALVFDNFFYSFTLK